jgi:hypothetical protein
MFNKMKKHYLTRGALQNFDKINQIEKTLTMASSRSSGRRRAATGPAFPALAPGIQNGLRRLVSDNQERVALMLDKKRAVASTVDSLCEDCATVMKQQQLSASSFLARFFDIETLSEHAVLLNKSGKGTAPLLAERIETAWAKNVPIVPAASASAKTSAAGAAATASSKTVAVATKRKTNAPPVESAVAAKKKKGGTHTTQDAI